uniref:BTB domain-containing protein n=1 Tax=Strigamia maritima TaxID=126957 RepID=T1ILI6_STRMM
MGSQQFSLRWKNHQTNLLTVFDQLLQNEAFVDVTLACDGLSIKAHKMVLSACSPYFQNLFIDNPCKHPIVILKDVKFVELKAIIDFMYKGEVNVSQDQLSMLLKTAETLQIKGLAEVTGNNCSEELRKSLSDLSNECVEDAQHAKNMSSEESDKSDNVIKDENNLPARKKRRLSKLNNSNNNDNENECKSENTKFSKTDETVDTSRRKNNLNVESKRRDVNNTSYSEGNDDLISVDCDRDKLIKGLNLQSDVKPSLEHFPKLKNPESAEGCPPHIANWAVQKFLSLPSVKTTNATPEPSTSTNVSNTDKNSIQLPDVAGQQSFKCTLCSKIFIDSKSLIEHSSLHLQRFECDVCGTCFANQRDLRRHEHRHIPIHLREPQFECQECGKRFHNQGSLVNHRNVHKERFKCDLCGHCSQSKVMLEKHK